MKDNDTYNNDYILRKKKVKQSIFLYLKICMILFIAYSLILSVYLYINPDTCPNERIKRVYNMEFKGYVKGYYSDCTKKITYILFNADTVKLKYDVLNFEKYKLNLEDEYYCLYYDIDVNDRIIKIKNSYKIILIKPNGKRLEYDPDCNTNYCTCKTKTRKPSDFEKYTSI